MYEELLREKRKYLKYCMCTIQLMSLPSYGKSYLFGLAEFKYVNK